MGAHYSHTTTTYLEDGKTETNAISFSGADPDERHVIKNNLNTTDVRRTSDAWVGTQREWNGMFSFKTKPINIPRLHTQRDNIKTIDDLIPVLNNAPVWMETDKVALAHEVTKDIILSKDDLYKLQTALGFGYSKFIGKRTKNLDDAWHTYVNAGVARN